MSLASMVAPTTTSDDRQAMDIEVDRLGLSSGGDSSLRRSVPVEAPIAIEICGIGYAVMMATPSDLIDYGTGFALSEGLIANATDILSIQTHSVDGGYVIRMNLPPEGAKKAVARARVRVTESSCGLCGIDNIAEVLRPLPALGPARQLERGALSLALRELGQHQPLNRATGAAHAAAFFPLDGHIDMVREDVGRHNALDKLIGGLARSGIDPSTGAFLLTARCSYELVEKTVRSGCTTLVTISAPTTLAVERARSAGLTLIALARSDSALVISGRDFISG